MIDAKTAFIEDSDIPWEATGAGVRRKVMAYDKNLMMVKVQFEKGAVGALHNHPHVQITFVENGHFEVEVDGLRKILKAGDAFYVPSDAMHGVICLEAGVLIDVFNPMREDFLNS